MAITYFWNIVKLDCFAQQNGMSNVVRVAHWVRKADDGEGHIGSFVGATELLPVPGEPFVSFESLTKDQVCAWLENSLGAERVTEIDAALNEQIDDQINPQEVSLPTPWS